MQGNDINRIIYFKLYILYITDSKTGTVGSTKLWDQMSFMTISF